MLSKLLSGGDGRRLGIIVPGGLGLLPVAGGGVMRRGIIVPGEEGFVILLLEPFIIYGFYFVNP